MPEEWGFAYNVKVQYKVETWFLHEWLAIKKELSSLLDLNIKKLKSTSNFLHIANEKMMFFVQGIVNTLIPKLMLISFRGKGEFPFLCFLSAETMYLWVLISGLSDLKPSRGQDLQYKFSKQSDLFCVMDLS